MRKIIAAILYIAGAVAMFFVYYQDQVALKDAMVVWAYFPWFWVGVVLVSAAALLWPKPRSEANGEDLREPEEEGELR